MQISALPGDNETIKTSYLTTGVEPQGEVLTKEREAFECELTEIENIALQATGQWPEQYMAELTELMDGFQRAGDYTGWETVRVELSRFEADRGIQTRHFVPEPETLLELQRKYYQLRDTLRRDKAKQIIEASESISSPCRTPEEPDGWRTDGGRLHGSDRDQAVRSRLDFIEAQTLLALPAPLRRTPIR